MRLFNPFFGDKSLIVEKVNKVITYCPTCGKELVVNGMCEPCFWKNKPCWGRLKKPDKIEYPIISPVESEAEKKSNSESYEERLIDL